MCSISFLREKHQQKQAKEEAALVTGGNVRQLDCIPVNTCDWYSKGYQPLLSEFKEMSCI